MGKWIFELNRLGKDLRSLISNSEHTVESCKLILEKLLECYNYIESKYQPKSDTMSWAIDELKLCVEDYLQDYKDPNMLYAYTSDCTDECLDAFYDFCDLYRIWIGL